jgi:hypothetical protein
MRGSQANCGFRFMGICLLSAALVGLFPTDGRTPIGGTLRSYKRRPLQQYDSSARKTLEVPLLVAA